MKKRKTAIACFLALVTAFIAVNFSACGKGGDIAPVEKLSQAAQNFIAYVDKIDPNVTLDSKTGIDTAYALYGALPEANRSAGGVVSAKSKLDGYKAAYEAVRAAADAEAERLAEAGRADEFIRLVGLIPAENDLTADSRAETDAARSVYDTLNETSKTLPDVAAAYQKLTAAEGRVAELEEEKAAADAAATALAFIAEVGKLPPITADAAVKDAIDALLTDYETYSDRVKAYAGVADAKAALDDALSQYTAAKDNADAGEFMTKAAAFSDVDTVALDSLAAIEEAEGLYALLSEAAKSLPGVSESKAALDAARGRYGELFAAAERIKIDAFITKAAASPEPDDVNFDSYKILQAAGAAYGALAFESRDREDVKEAYARYSAAQYAFDLLDLTPITFRDPTLLWSGDSPPHIVVQMEAYLKDSLFEFYGVSTTTALAAKVAMYLNIYFDGKSGEDYASRVSVSVTDFVGVHIIPNATVQNCLRTAADSNPEIQSGGTFAFSFSFEDRAQEYLPSTYTRIASGYKRYTF